VNKIDNILWQAKFLRENNWLKARKLLKESIKECPEDIRLYKELADLYFSKKLFLKAIQIYQDILSFNKDNSDTLFRIGNCFLSIKEYMLALEYYNEVTEKFPELYYNKSFAYSKIGKIDESIKTIKKLLSFKSSSEIPYIFLAELFFSQKKYSKAIEYLSKAEKLFGKQGNLYYLKGLAYSHLNKWLKSYVAYQKAEKMKVESYHFFRGFGLVCEKIGKIEQAIDNLLKSIKLAPSSATSYMDLIRIYLDHDRIMEAYSIIQHAKKNIPFSISLSLLYNQILQKIKQ
jgi:tetratricopeptide (TPR) repeat protein